MANGKPGAPIGNKNGAKKPFETALQAALARLSVDGRQPLIEIATKLIEAAAEGDRGAQVEIANRLDGKAKQQLDINAEVSHGLAEDIKAGRERAKQR